MGCFSRTRAISLPGAPRAPRRSETSGNASTRLHKRSERQKFELYGLGGEKRAFRITSDLVKLARRRREEPESSHQVSFGPSEATEKAGQHRLPGVLDAEDPSSKSERRDSVEWSEERAFQTVDSIVVKCRGRRFSRDLLGLPMAYIYKRERGLGKCHILRSTLSSPPRLARF